MSTTALPGYYTTKEAAEKLGYKVSDSLRQYCAQGKIPGVLKVGKTWLIPAQWVNEQAGETPKGIGNRGLERSKIK